MFSNGDLLFALTAAQPIDKYKDQWKGNEAPSVPHRTGMPWLKHTSFIFLITDEHQNKHSHVGIVGSNDASKVTSSRPAPVAEMKHLDGQESDETSETDCSNELIPEVLEKNQLTHLPKPSVDTRQVGSTNATMKKNIIDKKESNKKEYTVSTVFTDSSLSDSDSDVITTSKPIKGGAKTNGEQPKSSPKKRMTRKAVQEQQVTCIIAVENFIPNG